MTPKRISLYVIAGIVAFIIVLFIWRFATIRSRTVAKSIDEIQATEGFPVDVQEIQRGTVSRHLDILGNVQGIEQVDIISSLPIDVTGILKQVGDPVKKGEVVIRLARDRRGNAFHQYAMAKQALENAKHDLERMTNLHKEGAVSKQMLEQARLAYKNARAQYNEAVSMVDLISPIDGIVTMVNATVGSTTIPGKSLATVAAIDSVRIRCFVSNNEVAQIEVGQRAFIRTAQSGKTGSADSVPGKAGVIEGEITRVALSSDPESMLFLVEITAENVQGKLKPGTIAALSILVEERESVVKIPVDALVRRDAGDFVYLVSSSRAHLTPVTVGADNGDFVEVLDGAMERDTLVIRGQYRLTDNAPVNIRYIEGAD